MHEATQTPGGQSAGVGDSLRALEVGRASTHRTGHVVPRRRLDKRSDSAASSPG